MTYTDPFVALCLFQTATLTVGDKCDTQVAVLYGSRTGNLSCAAMATHVLQDR